MDFSSENLINEHSEKNYSHSAELVKILRDFCSDEKEIKEYLQVLEKDYLKQYMRDYSKVINKKFQEMSHTKEFDEKFNNLNSEQVKIICEDMNEYLYEFRETIRKEDKGIYDQQIYYNEATYSPCPNLSRNDLTMSEDHAKLVSRYLDKLTDERFVSWCENFDSLTDHSKNLVDSQTILDVYTKERGRDKLDNLGIKLKDQKELNEMREYIWKWADVINMNKEYSHFDMEKRKYNKYNVGSCLFHGIYLSPEWSVFSLNDKQKEAINIITEGHGEWYINKFKESFDHLSMETGYGVDKLKEMKDIARANRELEKAMKNVGKDMEKNEMVKTREDEKKRWFFKK